MGAKLTSRERFERMYQHRDADRIPIIDGPWKETIDRWVSEGMPDRDYVKHFDLDRLGWLSADNSPRYEYRVIEETDEYTIYTTQWGTTQRSWKAHGSTPEFLDFTIKSPDTWAAAKARMAPSDDRIDWKSIKENYPKWAAEGYWIVGGLWFGFDVVHSWAVGTERVLVAMIEEPEWCFDMFNHYLDVHLKLLDKIWDAGYRFHEVNWPDDMGYKHSQFFSLKVYRELLKPVHKRAIDWAHNKGIPARLHSCGDINPLLPELIEIGLDAINPLEVKAGMDPVALKAKYGDKLVFHGGINAALFDKPDLVIPEIERVVPIMKQNGGYIFSSDHSIPESVSFQNFTRIVEAAKRVGSYE